MLTFRSVSDSSFPFLTLSFIILEKNNNKKFFNFWKSKTWPIVNSMCAKGRIDQALILYESTNTIKF
jgi:hypothetical protein